MMKRAFITSSDVRQILLPDYWDLLFALAFTIAFFLLSCRSGTLLLSL